MADFMDEKVNKKKNRRKKKHVKKNGTFPHVCALCDFSVAKTTQNNTYFANST